MDLVGETLGHYQIIEELGKGGMATVYKAYQSNLQRHVAIKVLSPALAEDLDLVKRFLREARSAAALHHSNVIVIHDVGSEEDVHYIVSEYLEGMTLSQLLKQEQSLPPQRVLNIIRQIAEAMDYAHSRGYIHRDIKPSNIMVNPDQDDHVTLMDFGLVQVTGGSRITRTGYIMGTPDYMSPEQAKGEAIDHRTDIYSLGVTAYHMFTGKVPFEKPTPHAILLAHIMEEPPQMSLLNQQVSPEIEAVVLKAMAKEPGDRYEWSGDMVTDLETAIVRPGTFVAPMIPPTGPTQSATVVSASPAVSPAAAAPQPQTPPGGVTPYTQTPAGGVTPYPQTPPSGVTPYPQTPATGVPMPRAMPKWVWPLVVIGGFAVVAALIVVGILVGPSVIRLVSATDTPSVSPTPSATAAPVIQRFVVSPQEITQGESVTIEWQVTGVKSVSIAPGVADDTLPSGQVQHKPLEDTLYELILPNGERKSQQVKVKPAPGAPEVEVFEAIPQEPVRGARFQLSWKVAGTTTKCEISAGLGQSSPAVCPVGQLSLEAEKTTTYILTACNGERCHSRSVEVKVVPPSPTPTITPTATATEEPTSTVTEEISTPTLTNTPTPEPATPTPTPTRRPSTPIPTPTPGYGVLFSFEDWGTWKRGEQPYGELTQTQEQVKFGNYAAKLQYDFAGATDDFVVFVNLTNVSGQPDQITAHVYGDGSGHFVNAWIQDAKGEVWSIHLGKANHTGWKKLKGDIAPDLPWPSGHVFGPENDKIDYPIRFYGIVLDRPGSGSTEGEIYFDNIAFVRVGETSAEPDTTSTVDNGGDGTVQPGRIIFTVRVGESYSLYSTDPSWNKMVKAGDTTLALSTCSDNNTATTIDGTTFQLQGLAGHCTVAGTVDQCTSPNGLYRVNTNRAGSGYAVTMWRVSDNKQLEPSYQGSFNIHPGITWAPDSSHFLFSVHQSGYRGDVDKPGVHRVIAFKDSEWPVQYTPDGSYVFYLKPVNGAIADIFVSNPDGSNERNLTNSSVAFKMYPRWRR